MDDITPITEMQVIREWRDASDAADSWIAVAMQQQQDTGRVDPFVIEMIGNTTLAAKIASIKIKALRIAALSSN